MPWNWNRTIANQHPRPPPTEEPGISALVPASEELDFLISCTFAESIRDTTFYEGGWTSEQPSPSAFVGWNPLARNRVSHNTRFLIVPLSSAGISPEALEIGPPRVSEEKSSHL